MKKPLAGKKAFYSYGKMHWNTLGLVNQLYYPRWFFTLPKWAQCAFSDGVIDSYLNRPLPREFGRNV